MGGAASHRELARGVAVVALALGAAACGTRAAKPSQQAITVVQGAAAPAVHRVARIAAPSAPTPVPSPAPTPRRLAAITKAFRDPPLPPELSDDGGLAPLPPRPPAAALAPIMRPTFEPASITGEKR